MSAFLKINTNFTDSDSDSSSSEILTPRKTLLRIQTGLDLRSNTPSPPTIKRRSPVIIHKKIKDLSSFYSPKPNSVLRLIQTPKRVIKENNDLKLKIEKEIKNAIDEIITNVENKIFDKINFENMVHLSSNNLYLR